MVIKKKEFSKLSPCYLFEEIGKRKEKFLQQYKSAELISLGIGDTTLPLPEEVVRAMAMSAYSLATPAGYQGYLSLIHI